MNSEASVIAKTYCEVLRIMKEDLEEVLSNHRMLIRYVSELHVYLYRLYQGRI